jgi:hypothetical protein
MGNSETKLNIPFLLFLYAESRCRAQTMCQYAHVVFQIEPTVQTLPWTCECWYGYTLIICYHRLGNAM